MWAIDFEATASNMADTIQAGWFENHRGAASLQEAGYPHTVAYGNDGHGEDIRSQAEVAVLRMILEREGIKELGFGVSDDGYTWAMIVQTEDASRVAEWVSRAASLTWMYANAESKARDLDELVERAARMLSRTPES